MKKINIQYLLIIVLISTSCAMQGMLPKALGKHSKPAPSPFKLPPCIQAILGIGMLTRDFIINPMIAPIRNFVKAKINTSPAIQSSTAFLKSPSCHELRRRFLASIFSVPKK